MVVHGATSGLLIAGTEITGFFRQADRSAERTLHDVTVLGQGEHNFAPGRTNGSMSLVGLFDPTADALLEPFVNPVAQAEEPLSFAPEGFAAGKRVLFGVVRQASYKTGSKSDELVEAMAEFKESESTRHTSGLRRAGGFHSGLSGGPAASKGLGSTIVIDRGAAALTANQRAAFIVHSSVLPTAGAMYTDIHHSVDNVTYVSLGSAVGWGPGLVGGAFPHAISHGGMSMIETPQTINRYIRFTFLDSSSAPTYPTVAQASAAVFS